MTGETLKRGGRRAMQLPAHTPIRRHTDDALVKTLARAFRWKRLLDIGAFSTINDLGNKSEWRRPT